MIDVDQEVDRYLRLLRFLIREQGFIQLEIQQRLGWGRSYISQLLTKQKSLKLEQVLSILNVIRIEPGTFFGELYGFSSPKANKKTRKVARSPSEPVGLEEVRRLRALGMALREVLLEKGVVTEAELAEVVKSSERR